MEYRVFRQRLAKQMLQYSPIDNCYPVDSKLREYMRSSKDKRARAIIRKRPKGKAFSFKLPTGKVLSYHSLLCVHRTMKSGRFCSTLTDYKKHLERLIFKKKNTRKCYVCGEQTLFSCYSCLDGNKGTPLCWDTRRLKDKYGNIVRKYCFSIYHNADFFGLCRADVVLLHRPTQLDWQMWTAGSLDDNRKYMRHLVEGLADIVDIGVNSDVETVSTATLSTAPSAVV